MLPLPLPLACVSCQPQLGNSSKRALCATIFFLGSGHNKPPIPRLGESTQHLPSDGPAAQAFSRYVVRTLLEERRCGGPSGEEGRLSLGESRGLALC